MWYQLLPKIVNMSLTGGVVILAVLLTRLLLRKAPKAFSYALWLVVLFRLLCPISPPSSLSILNFVDAPLSSAGRVEYIPADIVHTPYPEVSLPLPAVNEAINRALPQGAEQTVADPLEFPVTAATYIWLAGMAVLLIYSVVKYIRLRRRLVGAALLRDNIYLADHIFSPFVLGLFCPKIYLPSSLAGRERDYIILHEQYHIRRLDHAAKILAFAALCVHWFNPLVWLAFALAADDMEMSCDEAVLKRLGQDARADYSQSLLSLATGCRIISGTPLAFGEGDTKGRVKNALRYHKPGLWAMVLAALVCLVAAGCLATNPTAIPNPAVQEYIPGQGHIQGNADAAYYEAISPDFAIGADKNGVAVFKDPQAAFATFSQLYAGGIALIQRENGLPPLTGKASDKSLDLYKTYGWQTMGGAEEERAQAAFVTGFLDIYENSFIKSSPAPNNAASTQEASALTLDDVIALSAKGEELTWSDFEPYAHIDVGSGLYILVYEIDQLFSLYIGGGSLEAEPMYIHLVANANRDDYVDVRGGDVEAFIRQRRQAASVATVGGAEGPEQAAVSAADPILTLSSNGETIEPYLHFLWSRTWESGGWLAADGLNLADSLPQLAADLPTLTLADDFALHPGGNAALSYISVYNDNYELLEHDGGWKRLRELARGTYYVGVVVSVQGQYIPAGEDYEAQGYQCLFKLIAP